MFAGYEWCSTEAYDANDPQQVHIMSQIELGNGLPCVRSTAQVMLWLRSLFVKCGCLITTAYVGPAAPLL